MNDDSEALKRHLIDLADRSYSRGIWTYSGFLDLYGQSILLSAGIKTPFYLCGGTDGAERNIAVFGSEELCGYKERVPISCIRISPLSAKFADELTHRDILGALMSLGIKREVLGDIYICGNNAYTFALDSMAEHIVSELTSIKHTTVSCEIAETVPDALSPEINEKVITAQSTRLDGVIASLYSLSRSDSQDLFRQGKIFVNGRECSKASCEPKQGDTVSVRGKGRFIFSGISGETKRGRLRIELKIYGSNKH